MLSDKHLVRALRKGRINLDPFEPELVQPSSIDVRLDRYFRIFNNHRYDSIDPRQEQADLTSQIEVPPGVPFILHPGEFVLACTFETLSLDKRHAVRLEGKSSLGRLGLLTHATAGFIDAGFRGQVTLELSNVANLPIKLWPGMKIGQICVFKLSSSVAHPYGQAINGSRYQGQVGPTASRSYENFRVWSTQRVA